MKKIIIVPDFVLIGQNYGDKVEFTDKGTYWEIFALVDGAGDIFRLNKSMIRR